MEYINIKIPKILMYLIFGFGIFAGAGSFMHSMTDSSLIGIATGGVFAIVVLVSMRFLGLKIKDNKT